LVDGVEVMTDQKIPSSSRKLFSLRPAILGGGSSSNAKSTKSKNFNPTSSREEGNDRDSLSSINSLTHIPSTTDKLTKKHNRTPSIHKTSSATTSAATTTITASVNSIRGLANNHQNLASQTPVANLAISSTKAGISSESKDPILSNIINSVLARINSKPKRDDEELKGLIETLAKFCEVDGVGGENGANRLAIVIKSFGRELESRLLVNDNKIAISNERGKVSHSVDGMNVWVA
jgi:hypothetical protein